MKFIEEIISDLTTEGISLSNILRKAKILSYQMKFSEFKDWINNELNGYNNPDLLPAYRKIKTQNFGDFSGSFGGRLSNVSIPTSFLPKEVDEYASNHYFMDNIRELESCLESCGISDKLSIRWPQEAIIVSRDKLPMDGGFVLVDAHKLIPKAVISGILDNVKNRLLDFLLSIEDLNLFSDNSNITQDHIDKARDIFLINIQGSNNIITSGENIKQNIDIKMNDLDSLLHCLRLYKFPESDLTDLKEAISKDGKPSSSGFGVNVKLWIASMMQKISDGLLQIPNQAITFVLIESLKKYFGS